MPAPRNAYVRFLALAILAAACTTSDTTLSTPRLSPAETRTPSPTPLGPPPTPVCAGTGPAPPHYNLDLTLNYAAHTAEVNETIRVVNSTRETWPDLALVASANHAPGVFDLQVLTVDGYPAAYTLEGVALRIALPATLEPGCEITLGAHYSLDLPRLASSAISWRGALGWTARQTLLGLWYPTLAPYRAGAGWVTHQPAAQGEYETTETSDVGVKLTLAGNKTDLTVVGSAAAQPCADAREGSPPGAATCFELEKGRHFALAFSDQMETATAAAGDTTVTALYFPEHSTAGQAALHTARDAFAVFAERFGPVPYKSLSVVEADLVDGMEFSGIFFLGRPYYAEFDGSPQNYLTLIAAHETAHQWWYSLVGNDSAAEPWLDEALATYSEEIYFETAHPNLVEWWWAFRVWQYLPAGAVGSDIYASREFRAYVDAVYLNGAQFLHALRGEAGDEIFFKFLRAYAANGAGRIATAEDFWRTYAEFGDAEGSAARRAYFGAAR